MLNISIFSQSSSDKSTISSEEIVPDLTVKSASSTNILARFPSDLLETSVDPDIDIKNTPSSDQPAPNETNSHLFQSTKDFEFLEQNLNPILAPIDRLEASKYQSKGIEIENSMRTIEGTTDSERRIPDDFIQKDKDGNASLPTASSISNQMQSKYEGENLEKMLETKEFNVTKSTLETGNSSDTLCSLEMKKHKSCEVGNYINSAAVISSTEEFLRESPSSGAQTQYQSEWPSSDPTNNINQVNLRIVHTKL